MGEEQQGDQEDTASPVVAVTTRAGRFSKEFLATVISLLTTALGVVAALAWNSALSTVFEEYLTSKRSKVTALFIYAVLVTAIGVVVIISLGKLATRIGAEPIEFKYPAKGKGDSG